MTLSTSIDVAVQAVRKVYPHPVGVGAILGSGLGDTAESWLKKPVTVNFADIPGFPASTVAGHAGTVLFGELSSGMHAAVFKGRVHYYEGHSIDKVVFPVRLLKALGADVLVVTNSAGGVNTAFNAGELMLITDHLNLIGAHPLIGPNDDALGPRFPDMSEAYTLSLRKLALEKARDLGIVLQQGVYCAMSGPTYETPAEVRMIRILGGDAVGMSTVPEVIAASHLKMQVLGVSCISNPAAGVLEGHRLNHEEVLEAASKARHDFSRLIESVMVALPAKVSSSV